MKREVPVVLVVAVALVIVAVVGYYGLIRPKHGQAARLDEDIAELDAKVTEARLAQRQQDNAPAIKVAELFDLSKAMPDEEDMAGVMLELNSVAASTGIRFVAIAPLATFARQGYQVQPIQLTFHGNYFDLTDFLFRLRNLVTVRDGVLRTSGRLFTLDTIDFHESPIDGFPQIEAILVVSAYVFDEASTATEGTAAPPAPTDTTTATTTAPSTEAVGGTP